MHVRHIMNVNQRASTSMLMILVALAPTSSCTCAGLLIALCRPDVHIVGISCVHGNVVSTSGSLSYMQHVHEDNLLHELSVDHAQSSGCL